MIEDNAHISTVAASAGPGGLGSEPPWNDMDGQYRWIVEHAHEGVLIVDLQGTIIYLNPRMATMVGYERDDLVERSAFVLSFDEDRPRMEELLSSYPTPESPGEFDVRLRCKDGGAVWARIRLAPVHDRTGRLIGLLILLMDISDRKQAEETQRRSEECFRLMAEATGTVVFDVAIDPDRPDPLTGLPEVTMNALHGVTEFLGYSWTEWRPTFDWWTHQIHPEDFPRFLQDLLEAAAGGQDYTWQYRVRHRQGHYVHIETNLRILRDAAQRPIRAVGRSRDITGQKRAEEALREREELLRILADNLPHVMIYQIVEENRRPRFAYISASVQRLNEVSPEAVLADPMVLYGQILPQYLTGLRLAEIKAALTQAPFHYEIQCRLPSGRLRWFELASAPRRLADGRLVWDGVEIDITEQKEMLEDLRRLNEDLEFRVRERTAELQAAVEELRRSNEDLEKFAYISSHDLQEPLRMVASYVGLLENEYRDKLDGNAREYIAYAVEGAQRMSLLIKDLLAYSRINSESHVRGPADAGKILDEVLRGLSLKIEEARAQVTVDPLPIVLADSTQLAQVFQNLLENAIKYRKDNDAPIIHVSAESRDGEWLFSVRDNGIGIEPAYYDQIFLPFKRLHARRDRYPGSGIGLAIVKRIIERHHGRVGVTSALGQGSTFYFTLPAAGKETPCPAPHEDETRPRSVAPDKQGGNS